MVFERWFFSNTKNDSATNTINGIYKYQKRYLKRVKMADSQIPKMVSYLDIYHAQHGNVFNLFVFQSFEPLIFSSEAKTVFALERSGGMTENLLTSKATQGNYGVGAVHYQARNRRDVIKCSTFFPVFPDTPTRAGVF